MTNPARPSVLLRPFARADEPALTRLFADPETLRWNPGQTADGVAAWWVIANEVVPDARTWAVADLTDDRLLGTVSLFAIDTDQQTAEVGYRVLPAERGRGVGTAGLAEVARRGFGELGLLRIQLFHAIQNVGSCQVALRAGFAQEGVLRSSFRYGDDRRHDEHVHGRLAGD